MRRLTVFACEGDALLGSYDAADGGTGVLIVSGGNEPRAGAHRWQASLAQALAARGVPAFRYDRRGVGDSSGENRGWAFSASDMAAAVSAFHVAQPQVTRVIGFGNCDGATALALFGAAAGIDAVVLANPWLGDDDPLPPPAAIRARYARRLFSPVAWRRLLTSRDGWRKLAAGLQRATSPAAVPSLADRIAAALAGRDATIVLAHGDRTAQAFAAAWTGRQAAPIIALPSDSHSFVDAGDAVAEAIVAAVHRRP